MIRSLADLRNTPDDVLIAEHDMAAAHVGVIGTDYYARELERRDMARAAQRTEELAARSYWLAVATLVLSVVAVIISVLAIVH